MLGSPCRAWPAGLTFLLERFLIAGHTGCEVIGGWVLVVADSGTKALSVVSCLLVEDDSFTRHVISDGLTGHNICVTGVGSVAEAISELSEREPHILVTDLHLGPGPDGADLLTHVTRNWPWVAKVVLTTHTSANIAVGMKKKLPSDVIYIVKGDVTSIAELADQIRASLESAEPSVFPVCGSRDDYIYVSADQAEALRLMAMGLNNASIAQRRGVGLRSAEALVQRTFAACGLTGKEDISPRVVASQLWLSGRIRVRAHR